MPTETNPTRRDILLPYTTRENTSLPRVSVPKGCEKDGDVRIFRKSGSTGSWRDMKGAKRAHKNMGTRIIKPTSAMLCLLILRSNFTVNNTLYGLRVPETRNSQHGFLLQFRQRPPYKTRRLRVLFWHFVELHWCSTDIGTIRLLNLSKVFYCLIYCICFVF